MYIKLQQQQYQLIVISKYGECRLFLRSSVNYSNLFFKGTENVLKRLIFAFSELKEVKNSLTFILELKFCFKTLNLV